MKQRKPQAFKRPLSLCLAGLTSSLMALSLPHTMLPGLAKSAAQSNPSAQSEQTQSTPSAASVPIPDAMITRNIPSLSLQLKADVKQYRHVRSAAFVDWYPSGSTGQSSSEILITTRFANTYQLHRLQFSKFLKLFRRRLIARINSQK